MPTSILDFQYDFTEVLAGFHAAVRFLGFLETEYLVNRGTQMPRLDKLQHLQKLRKTSHIGAEETELSRIKSADIDLRFGAGRGAASHHAAAAGQRQEIPLPSLGTDVLKHHVYAEAVCQFL